MANERSVTLENVKLIFKNFEGKEGPYNRAGQREFSVILDQKTAAAMIEDGWNVKVLKVREEGDEEIPYLPVAVNYKGRPPQIVMITSRGRTTLHEDEAQMVDWADIRTADLIVNPYDWSVNGKTGVKAYLKSLYLTIEEDELELKYAGIEEAKLRKRLEDDN